MLRGLFKPKSKGDFNSTQSPKKLKWIKRGALASALILAVGVPVGLQAAEKYKVTKELTSNSTYFISAFSEVTPTAIKKVDGGYAYCVNMTKGTPNYVHFSEYATEDTSSSKVKNIDKVWRCIKYGYPNITYWKTGHSQKTKEVNYYATQLAVWSYTETKFNTNSKIDNLTYYSGRNSIGATASWSFTKSDAQKIKTIVKEIRAKVEADTAPMKPSLAVSPTKTTSYYSNVHKRNQSKKITVRGNNIKGEVDIVLSGTDSDKCYVVDAETNEKITKIAVGKQFRVIFPDGVDSTKVTYKVSGSGEVESGLVYTTAETGKQNVIKYKPITRKADASSEGTVTFEHEIGSLEIKKVDEKGNVLEGATFSLEGKDVVYKEEGLVTDKNGIIHADGLKPGTYTVTETNPPSGYVLPENPSQDVKVENGKTAEVSFTNKKTTELSIKIVKTDQDGNYVPGVKFKIWNEDKSLEKEVTTNDIGVATVKVEKLGKYYVQEISAPTGYKIDSKVYEHTFTEDNNLAEFNIVNKLVKGALKITKYDAATNNNLAGAVFKVTNTEEGYEKQVTVGKDGTATLEDLALGTYTVKEVTAPEGYELADKEYTVEVKEDSTAETPVEVKVPNTKMPSGMELTKTDISTGEVLEGAHFKIYKEDKTTVVVEGVTTATGKATFKLDVGKYYYQETLAPSGYKLDDEMYEFEVKPGEITKCQAFNKKKDTGMELTKTDVSTGETLPNAEFKIYKEDKTTVVTEGKTNEKGIAYFKLDAGKYYYQEISAPNGYKVDDSLYEFEVKDGEITKCQMTNVRKETGIEITKVDVSTGDVLPGATFAIYAEDGKTLVTKGVTDEKGIAYFKLDYGKYYYQEVNAPNGYQVDNTKFPFEIKENNEIIRCKMTNKPIIPKTGVTEINKYATVGSITLFLVACGILILRKKFN